MSKNLTVVLFLDRLNGVDHRVAFSRDQAANNVVGEAQAQARHSARHGSPRPGCRRKKNVKRPAVSQRERRQTLEPSPKKYPPLTGAAEHETGSGGRAYRVDSIVLPAPGLDGHKVAGMIHEN